MERPRRGGRKEVTYDERSDDSGDESGDDSDAGNGKGTEPRATRDSHAISSAALTCLFGLHEFCEADYAGDGILYPATVTRVKPPAPGPRSPAWHRRTQQTLYDITYADGDVGKNLLGRVES